MTDQPELATAVWIDGDPLMEAIAATVWEHCARDDKDMPQLVCDDPRTIAAWAAAVARTHRADTLREAADICDEAGAVYGSRGANDAAGAAFALMERFQRKANEAEYVATPCDFVGCEPGGEPCSTHERLMAHAEGDHELCAPDCLAAASAVVVRRATDETQGEDKRCGLWGGCPLPRGHNMGQADIPENHQPPAVGAQQRKETRP